MHSGVTFLWIRSIFSRRFAAAAIVSVCFSVIYAKRAAAQEPPYFVTYSDALEEPGNLEVAVKGVQAAPKNANSFSSATLELEYGAKGWWTTEVYLSGQTTQNDSTVFTGFRWENRVRPLL